MPQVEVPLWFVCICCVLRGHVQESERSLWLFCSLSMNSPGLHWGLSGVGFRDRLASILARPPLLTHA